MTRRAPRLTGRGSRGRGVYAATALVACLGSGFFAVALAQEPICGRGCHAITAAATPPKRLPGAATLPERSSIITVGGPLHVRPVGAGFLGLSIEYYAVQKYAGRDPHALNPVFLQLVRNLDPGQSPVIRIGGDSADWAWVPAPGITKPLGAKVTITPGLLRVLGALGAHLDARLILGLNLEADNVSVARAEAAALVRSIGRAHVRAFEIGNEPELYPVLGWYHSHGRSVPGRRSGYDLAKYEREFRTFAARLPRLPLAGPSSGLPAWTGDLGSFSATAPRVGVITVHRYPLQRCQLEPGTPGFPTIRELLAPSSSVGLAESVIPIALSAHAHGKAIRVDEINSVSCFGAQGVSNTFAAALWALETSFAMARVGVDGVNFHTLPGAVYGLFSFRRVHGRWAGHVAPAYYGLLAFAKAAPAGAKLLRTSGVAHGLQTWATQSPDGTTHVLVINTGHHTRTVGLRLPGRSGAAALSYLHARTLSSRTVRLGNRTFGASTSTGALPEPAHNRLVLVQPRRGLYVVDVPSPSAAILTVPGGRASR